MRVLIVIPARGGSKGIPRKNLRPLAGKPLIHYSIRTALSVQTSCRVVVSTDDNEIALFAERFGADVLIRPKELGADTVTLDPVIVCATKQAEKRWSETYDAIITIQPTSPLICAEEIKEAIRILRDDVTDTVLSVVDDRHLTWTIRDNQAFPLYNTRVNRQQLPEVYKETGAIIGCTIEQLRKGTRIGSNVSLLHMPYDRSVDIDSFSDLAICESLLLRKRIVFTVIGYDKVGLGHAYRALMLAHELVQYDLHFVCEERSDLAINEIRKHNYLVHVCDAGQLVSTITNLSPEMVINDILDTDTAYMSNLSENGIKTINFEDMGSGASIANLVINALYPHQPPLKNMLAGPKYFGLRDEFLYLPARNRQQTARRILLTFGGVDEGNLTARTLLIASKYTEELNFDIDVVVGPGFDHYNQLTNLVTRLGYARIKVHSGTSRISDYMCIADMAVTSGGRTVLELAALNVPTIVICQNRRETTHTFASCDNGVLNLGYRGDISDKKIEDAILRVLSDPEIRNQMIEKSSKLDLTLGKKRIISKIIDLLKS
ncbi:cytidylyltransferase domain-containing protein [Aestuariirhabdus sp. LZHN29]|uniref:cytidylyltransferase domain-containing protein n=1 Tax=Aestuariirhabdus sp. LZHN29 TaxID=3417462 RepID=UPI003CE6837E